MWQDTPYNTPLAVSATLVAWMAVYVWRHRGQPGASPLCLLLLDVAIWSFASALEIASASRASKMFWNGVLYIGIVTAPAAMLLFALDYGGRRLPLTLTLSLLVEPVLVLVMVWAEGLRQGWVSGYMRLIPTCCCFWGRCSWCGNINTRLRPTDARSVRCLRLPCCPSRQCTLYLWAQPLSASRPDAFCLRCYRADLRLGAIALKVARPGPGRTRSVGRAFGLWGAGLG